MADSEPVIGIDLGTTNSVVAVVLDGEVHVIPDEEGHNTQASMVAFAADGSLVVGNHARREAIVDPVHTVFSAKRLIGRHFDSPLVQAAIKQLPYKVVKGRNQVPQIEIRGERYGLPEISGMVLRRMKDIAESYLKRPVHKRAVVTVPANFDDTQRQMTKLSGELADLEVLRVINEPTAAALAYGYGRDVDARLAIYDFGGGTFDITLLTVAGAVFEVGSTAGDTFLGGDDFDDRLARYMALAFKQQNGRELVDPIALNRLRHVAEKLKRELSRKDRAIVNVRELDRDDEKRPLDLRFQLDRRGFEERCQDIVQRTFLVCDEALREARMKATDLDGVVLVGGSTRIPLVREMVAGYFGQEPFTELNPDEVVAIGAAIQGAALAADAFAPDARPQPLLLDVTPMSLGVQTVGGFYEVLIQRNSSVPCEQSRIFTTTSDNQGSVRLRIFQGESRTVGDNTQIGEVELFGLRQAPRGEVQVEVVFEIDTDGLVMVTARDRETGVEQAARIDLAAGYSAEEVGQMKRRSGRGA
jgi:molecular chaperone DnaK